jgi:hypothetical protein
VRCVVGKTWHCWSEEDGEESSDLDKSDHVEVDVKSILGTATGKWQMQDARWQDDEMAG